jgi:hypothetical protein
VCVSVGVWGMGGLRLGVTVSVWVTVICKCVCVFLGVCVLRASCGYLSGEGGGLETDLCDSPNTQHPSVHSFPASNDKGGPTDTCESFSIVRTTCVSRVSVRP